MRANELDGHKVIAFFVVTFVAGAAGYYWYGDWGSAIASAIAMIIGTWAVFSDGISGTVYTRIGKIMALPVILMLECL